MLELCSTLALVPSVKWAYLMVCPDETILRTSWMSSTPISSKPQFMGILEVQSIIYEVLNSHPYVLGDMSFHLFTQVKIHLYFVSHAIFSYPNIHSPFFPLLTFVSQSFLPHPSHCLLFTIKILPYIKHAIFIHFYKHLKFPKWPKKKF